jgi:hypothetical protein
MIFYCLSTIATTRWNEFHSLILKTLESEKQTNLSAKWKEFSQLERKKGEKQNSAKENKGVCREEARRRRQQPLVFNHSESIRRGIAAIPSLPGADSK